MQTSTILNEKRYEMVPSGSSMLVDVIIDETVDVASSGDLAVYRGTYNEENGNAGVVMTHKTNFLAEFRRQSDKSWRIVWYSVSNMEQSHPK